MERTLGSAATLSIPPSKKASARVALVNLTPASHRVLNECFRQFGMEGISMSHEATERLQKEKFEACVVRVQPESEPVMMSARNSPSNSRLVIYGLGGSAQDAIGFSKYGINAIFHEPLERQAALKLVRATQPLITHEFRRYVRIPIVTEINVVLADNRRFPATSVEISTGGMSFKTKEEIPRNQALEVSFALLTLPRIWLKGAVTWHKPKGSMYGMRFDPNDDRRMKIKNWVESYLEC
jgi:PilZ domain